MEVAKVTSKGQITIPISIRRKLQINEGDKVLFIYKPEGVMMVNPNTLQGEAGMDIMKTAEAEPAVKTVAATESKAPEKTAVQSESAASVEADDDMIVAQYAGTAQATPQAASQAETSMQKRPVPPPVEEPEKPAKQAGGLDLSTLLDDIRSIGSNI